MVQVLELVRSSGSSIKTTVGWRTVCLLITTTSLSPEACSTSLAALHETARDPVLSPIAFMHCLESAAAFIDNQNKVNLPHSNQCTTFLKPVLKIDGERTHVSCKWKITAKSNLCICV